MAGARLSRLGVRQAQVAHEVTAYPMIVKFELVGRKGLARLVAVGI